MTKKTPDPTARQLAREVGRLKRKGLLALGYTEPELENMGDLIWRINRLKAEKKAVIPGHVYQRAEVLAGVADFVGDSYRLAKLCTEVEAKSIVFCGVRFMAETAKILNPDKAVFLPAKEAGCSLSDSITAGNVRALKRKHPGAPVVTYINTTVDVKAESDVIVTSANAVKILTHMYKTHKKIIFLPDAWMGRNLARQLGKKLGSELVVWHGKCIVHESFDESAVPFYRSLYPGVKLLAHSECSPALVELMDFVGGTGDMMKYVRGTKAPYYMLITECGLGELARGEMPEKRFIPMCRLCPYMKAVTLERILLTLESPEPEQRIQVSADVARRARLAIERMFDIAEDRARR